MQRERIHVWVLTLRSLHGAHKSNQIRAPAKNHPPYSKRAVASEPYGDRGRDSLILEIPRGMQTGPLSSRCCGRWNGAHQWLEELMGLTEHKPFHTAGVAECA